jgi:hypothetical protein
VNDVRCVATSGVNRPSFTYAYQGWLYAFQYPESHRGRGLNKARWCLRHSAPWRGELFCDRSTTSTVRRPVPLAEVNCGRTNVNLVWSVDDLTIF